MSQQWKPGDVVTFTLTGTIANINDGLATIEYSGIPLKVHVSHIVGTPEQAKRERIMAMLRNEFPSFGFEPAPNDESGIVITCKFPILPEVAKFIKNRMADLQEQEA